jgi:hypothetical protein
MCAKIWEPEKRGSRKKKPFTYFIGREGGNWDHDLERNGLQENRQSLVDHRWHDPLTDVPQALIGTAQLKIQSQVELECWL